MCELDRRVAHINRVEEHARQRPRCGRRDLDLRERGTQDCGVITRRLLRFFRAGMGCRLCRRTVRKARGALGRPAIHRRRAAGRRPDPRWAAVVAYRHPRRSRTQIATVQARARRRAAWTCAHNEHEACPRRNARAASFRRSFRYRRVARLCLRQGATVAYRRQSGTSDDASIATAPGAGRLRVALQRGPMSLRGDRGSSRTRAPAQG